MKIYLVSTNRPFLANPVTTGLVFTSLKEARKTIKNLKKIGNLPWKIHMMSGELKKVLL